MSANSMYEDIAKRTDGNIYIGVVGPVRTGKSTFIKRFMDALVIPNIENEYAKERARDELPQSASGRTIMTSEPKFVPEEAVTIPLGPAEVRVRLIDCVGYMVPGAQGQFEDGLERMVTTPWSDTEVTLSDAAELGTKKVIEEHATIGIVVTTDGSITDIPRDSYLNAEARVITEMRERGKPFLVVVNSRDPQGAAAQSLKAELETKFNVSAVTANCQTLTENEITELLQTVLYEFPIAEFGVFLPKWIDVMPNDNSLKSGLIQNIIGESGNLNNVRDALGLSDRLSQDERISGIDIVNRDFGTGTIHIEINVPRELFYKTLSEQSDFEIADDGDLAKLLVDLSSIKREYDRLSVALKDVREKGYGIVMPTREELRLEEPEIVRQGGRYGVKLKASAPSIHMIMANIETEVSPAVGGERASEDVINFLLQEFEGDISKIWESNMFGKSLYDIAGDSLGTKANKIPEETKLKLRNTVQRIINDGSGRIICIIL